MTTFKKIVLYSLVAHSASWAQEPTETAAPSIDYLAQDPPNVILIIGDNLGVGDFSSEGNTWIKTPQLDKLASLSTRWENFYVCPEGAPSRASIFTGRYHMRTRCLDTQLGRSMMASDETTIAEVLQSVGYKTGIFGKWELGDHYPMRPSDQGFSASLVLKGSGIGSFSDPIENTTGSLNPLLFKNDQETLTSGYANDVFFEAAQKFMGNAQRFQQPFFATIALDASPAPADLLAKYSTNLEGWGENPAALAQTAVTLNTLDANVGKLFEFLEKNELTKNTVIIFTSDNGPECVRYNKQLKGGKGNVHEGGVRAPLWIHVPAKENAPNNPTLIKQNVAAHIDIMPTILDICGLDIAAAYAIDGRSLLPQIQEPTKEFIQRPLVIQWHNGATAVPRHHFMLRQGNWKLLNPSDPTSARRTSAKYELYDLSVDPSELNNLADKDPKMVETLLETYKTWFKDVTETRLREPGTPYILVDKERENPLVLSWQDRIAKSSSYTDQGFWKLSFEHSGRCDVRLEFPHDFDRDLTGWTVNISIGKENFTQTVQSKSSIITLPALNYQAGKHLLKAVFTSPDGSETISAYQVRINHR